MQALLIYLLLILALVSTASAVCLAGKVRLKDGIISNRDAKIKQLHGLIDHKRHTVWLFMYADKNGTLVSAWQTRDAAMLAIFLEIEKRGFQGEKYSESVEKDGYTTVVVNKHAGIYTAWEENILEGLDIA